MSLLERLRLRTGFINPNPELALLPEIVRYFLNDAIKERARILAEPGNEDEKTYIPIVTSEYSQRLERILTDEIAALKESNRDLTFPLLLQNKLNTVYFREPLKDADFKSPKSFSTLLGKVRSHFNVTGLFIALPLPPDEGRAIASLLLRCVQKVALQIISNDYPATAKRIVVPQSTQSNIKNLLKRVDEIASVLGPNPPPKTLPRAEAEVNVAVARSELRVALPLRSIPTAPLADSEVADHYIGRPDEDAKRLARQVRHADGTILVTGYRGVGKSSFVNRVIYHAKQYQKTIPSDGWIIVPVTINLAKVIGVQNVLRLTLRAVRNELIDPDTALPRPIPGFENETVLPLIAAREIDPLQEAYSRATYKVTMTRANATETKLAADASLGFDVSKVFSPFTGLQLPGFGFKGSRSRTQTVNRSLSLLDYDENAAEEDLGKLIRQLATPRPLYGDSGPMVRLKLVFIFDELDKMNMDDGLRPMIEGLKNLFLQQFAVFILVTSKGFYYHLLKERTIEDGMLNSYFSAIVPVPLLTFDQARKMVADWVDWPDTVQEPLDIEDQLLNLLTRWLLYRSYGNPRDIIRELRQMQEWADTTERPYVSDALTKLKSLQIFAGIQDCIERAARPDGSQISTTPDGNGGGVTLVSERIGGDESRLEQIRRGLYILTEALITQETLSIKTEDLKQFRENNFSLLLDSDVEQLARKLGFNLSLLHQVLPADVFGSLNGSTRPQLFVEVENTLRTTPEFYRITGLQASASEPTTTVAPATTDEKEMVELAETRARSGSWAERRSAIQIIKNLKPANVTEPLKKFLLDLTTNKNEPLVQRREAAKQLTSEMLFSSGRDLSTLLLQETDDEVLNSLLALLGKAADDEKARATNAVISLFKVQPNPQFGISTTSLMGKNVETAMTVLHTIADRDVIDDVLMWFCSTLQTADVQEVALAGLNLLAQKLNVDQAEKILSNNAFLKFFARSSRRPDQDKQFGLAISRSITSTRNAVKFESHLLNLFKPNPLYYIERLLHSDASVELNHLLTPLWQYAFDRSSPELAEFVFKIMAGDDQTAVSRVVESLQQTPEFELRMLHYLQYSFEKVGTTTYTAEQLKKIQGCLTQLATSKPTPIAIPPSPSVADILKEIKNPDNPIHFRKPTVAPGQVLLAALAVVATIAIELFFFKRDLPPDASFAKQLLSRLVIFAADLALVVAGLGQSDSYGNARRSKPELTGFGYAKTSSNVGLGQLVWVSGVLFFVHARYIGPLSFWNQLLIFFINLTAAILISRPLINQLKS